MDSEIIGALITAVAGIISAIIGGWVAIKIKGMELKAKEDRTGLPIAEADKKSSQWLWGIVGAFIGASLIFGFLSFTNIYSFNSTPTVVANVPSPSATSPLLTPTTVDSNTSTPIQISTKIPVSTPTETPHPTNTPRPTPPPTATIDADPTMYDNFENPENDGGFNRSQWDYWSENRDKFYQENSVLHSEAKESVSLISRNYRNISLQNPTFYEAKLKLGRNTSEGSVVLKLHAQFSGEDWVDTQCGIFGKNSDERAWAFCDYTVEGQPAQYTEGMEVDFDTWYLVRIEADPIAKTYTYYINDVLQSKTFEPPNTETAKFALVIETYTGSGTTFGYFDDVRIGHIGQ